MTMKDSDKIEITDIIEDLEITEYDAGHPIIERTIRRLRNLIVSEDER